MSRHYQNCGYFFSKKPWLPKVIYRSHRLGTTDEGIRHRDFFCSCYKNKAISCIW